MLYEDVDILPRMIAGRGVETRFHTNEPKIVLSTIMYNIAIN